MSSHETQTRDTDLVTIARDASLVEWLLDQKRLQRRLSTLSANLRSDLGLHPLPRNDTGGAIARFR